MEQHRGARENRAMGAKRVVKKSGNRKKVSNSGKYERMSGIREEMKRSKKSERQQDETGGQEGIVKEMTICSR